MYTWSNKDKSLQSRTDFWLVSASTAVNVERTDIEPTIFTDHKAISIRINLSKRPKINTDYWKLNKTLIQNHTSQIKKLIEKYWRQAVTTNLYRESWELLKYEIRRLAIVLGKKMSKTTREKELQIVTKIMNLS